jgi:hypothetical protein
MQDSIPLGTETERGGSLQATPRELVDQKLRRLGRDRTKLEHETCALLLEGQRLGVHRSYGYASIREYAEAFVGLSPRETEERLRVARALETLPEIAAKFRAAELTFTAVRELTRVASADTEREWLEAAGQKSTRQIECLVSGHVTGDRPTDPAREEARRHRVVLDLSGHAFALLRDAKTELVKSTGHALDDDAFIMLLSRALLFSSRAPEAEPPQGGEREPPQGGHAAEPAVASNYRIGLVSCPTCHRTVRTGGSEDVVVEPHVLEAAMCHAELVPVDGEPARATQTIPPKIQRHVLLRHHNRCAVPGCRHAVLDLHHLDERAEGGTHDPNRMLPLCGAHHDAAHRRVLLIGGDANTGFTFKHADGREYGSSLVAPRRAQDFANAEGALCSMGVQVARGTRDGRRHPRHSLRRRHRRAGALRSAPRRAEREPQGPRLRREPCLRPFVLDRELASLARRTPCTYVM